MTLQTDIVMVHTETAVNILNRTCQRMKVISTLDLLVRTRPVTSPGVAEMCPTQAGLKHLTDLSQ